MSEQEQHFHGLESDQSGAYPKMLAVLPRTHESAEIAKMATKVTRRAKHRNETVLATWKAWIPYHRIWIACSHVEDSRPEKVVTALNAVFCLCAKTEPELMQIFRPRHLERPLVEIDPNPEELVCSYPAADLNSIIDGLIKVRAEIRDQLAQIGQKMVKADRRIQLWHLFLPTPTSYLERGQATSAKFAQLQSRSMAIDLCLNLTSSLLPTKVEGYDIIHIPMAVAQLRETGQESDRYVLVDLATGRLDTALTTLCESEADFRAQLVSALR